MTEILIKIGAVLALLAALFFAERYIEGLGYSRARAEDQAAAATLKAQAATTLATETKAKLDAQAQLSNLIAEKEIDRENKQLANRADLRTRQSGPRLQFAAEAGCGSGRGGAAGAAPGAPSDPGATVVQLPEPLNGNLLGFAADAQSLAIDYGVLYDFLHNPKLVCELRP